MIHLITGVPGAGKTLFAISLIKERAEKEGRPVYYNGIPELKLPWIEFDDPEKWPDLPDGSIVVIDECQRSFRPRHSTAKVPAHVELLETHRHKGFDIYFITQHPTLVDNNVRRLVGRHFHATRRWGWTKSVILDFETCKDNPILQKAGASRIDFHFPKSLYGVYKSAEVHTHKARIPPKIIIMILMPVIFIVALFMGVSRLMAPASSEKTAQEAGAQSSGIPVSPASARPAPRISRDDYIADYQPRLTGLDYTAPRYDDVTRPVTAPFPDACIVGQSSGCKCYSQQGTRLDVPDAMCRSIVERGYFKDWEEERGRGQSQQAQAPAYRDQPAVSVSPQMASSGNDQVAMIPHRPDGFESGAVAFETKRPALTTSEERARSRASSAAARG